MHPENLNSFSNSHHPENSADLPGSTHTKHFETPVLSETKSRPGGTTDLTHSTHSTHSRLLPAPKLRQAGNTLTTAFFYLSILFFIIGFNFSDVMVGNWYQQFMPGIGGRTITDVFFLDSLTGWGVTNARNQNPDTTFVLKTTDGGDNWVLEYGKIQTGGGFSGYFRVYFLNQNTGFTCGVTGIDKTTDGGTSWISLNAPSIPFLDMSVLNVDTIWLVDDNSAFGGVFRTTNGGATWDRQLDAGAQNPDRIYMFNSRIGFVSRTNSNTRKTTDSGVSWTVVANGSGQGFYDMYFADSLTGWGIFSNMRKTTDGGLNWIVQPMPTGGNITVSSLEKLSGLNKDTIWGTGAFLLTSSGFRGMINRTTNGGDNWLFQVPDSVAIQIGQYKYIDFVNKLNGWAYDPATGIHTKTGGDPIWYTGIVQISNNIPKDFELHQNYPNPFNPRTVIPFSLKKSAYVRLIAYDITGREVQKMVDGKYSAGEYEVDFNGKFTASGVYFYKLTVENGKEVYSETKKMLLIK